MRPVWIPPICYASLVFIVTLLSTSYYVHTKRCYLQDNPPVHADFLA